MLKLLCPYLARLHRGTSKSLRTADRKPCRRWIAETGTHISVRYNGAAWWLQHSQNNNNNKWRRLRPRPVLPPGVSSTILSNAVQWRCKCYNNDRLWKPASSQRVQILAPFINARARKWICWYMAAYMTGLIVITCSNVPTLTDRQGTKRLKSVIQSTD